MHFRFLNLPDGLPSGILFVMAQNTPRRSRTMSAQTARAFALVFLFVGMAFGVFAAPHYAAVFLEKLHVPSSKLQVLGSQFPYSLGLDIQGGTHLLYRADVSATAPEDLADSMESLRNVIERRVNLFGVAEPVVQIEKSGDEQRLIVELAGIKDIGDAIKLIGETPFLEFRAERDDAGKNEILAAQEAGDRFDEDPFFVPTPLTGRFIKKASIDFDPITFQPGVALELTDEGAGLFARLTGENVGKRLAIYLDGVPISAPVVQQEIDGGRAQITGNFTPESARELAGRLNAGALPVPISLISQQNVGASLGEESFARSVRAAFFGFLAVAIFLILWYRLPGLVAVCALLFYTALVLAIFKLISVTLTIAGIAGFILSLGVAVDANILIFERIKDEMRGGKSVLDAIRHGFGRAWTSIRDANISTLITASILYWLGVSVVQGFALTLAIGVLVSMFSAVVVTRTFLLAVTPKRADSLRFLFLSGFQF